MMDSCFKTFGEWELRQRLGSGAFGEVFLWMHRESKLKIATKSLKKNNSLGRDEEQKLRERWQQEYELSRNLNTEHIVKGIALEDKNFIKYLNDNHAWRPLPVMIMEYCNGGDLRAHLQKMENLNGLTEFEVRNVLHALSGAIEYMHTKYNIKHRDLKPDNIVIHHKPNGERIYKLTDFGFARFINDKTMLLSVVGTRNYFAPEVVDTSEYTKTVDYWSMGVIAFEMLCGCLPFIPHQNLYNIIKCCKNKPRNCICITEHFEKPNEFEYSDRIFDENRVSATFRTKIEDWLRLALDTNHRTRGTSLAGPLEIPSTPGGRVLKFYTQLREILDSCVLTTFDLTSNSFNDFEIKQDTKISALVSDISNATNIPLSRMYSILPVGHPLKCLSDIKQAKDLFVEQWRDTTDASNPAVMLYLVDIEPEKSSKFVSDPKISALLKHCFRIAEKELPIWLYQKFAMAIHHLLAQEQHNLKTSLNGLREYAMNIEEEILNYKTAIEKVIQDANVTNGRILQYESMICEAKIRLTNKKMPFPFNKWETSIRKFQERANVSANKIIPKLLMRHSSAFRRIKEESNSTFYDELIKKDVFEVDDFRHHLQKKHQGFKFDALQKPVPGCGHCHKTVNEFIEKRSKVLEVNQKRLRTISDIHTEHRMIKKTTEDAMNMLKNMNLDIQNQTSGFYKEFVDEILPNIERSTNIAVDGLINVDSNNSSRGTSLNNLCNSFNDIIDISTKELIKEAAENIQLMSMDNDHNENNIPETVNFV